MARKVIPVVSDEDEIGDELPANIPVQAAAPPPAQGVKKINMPGNKGVKTLRILLEENSDIPPSGQFIGHNGTSYLLRAGQWVDVPMPLIEVLNNAVSMVPDRDQYTQQIIGWREKLRYPYRVAPGQAAA